MKGITPILAAKPDDETRQGKSSSPRGPYPHIVADSGREEVLAWAVERSDGGRGFGFTGAHFHRNWGNENFRKIILNALLWTAHAEVRATHQSAAGGTTKDARIVRVGTIHHAISRRLGSSDRRARSTRVSPARR